jgi:hypothetical protein
MARIKYVINERRLAYEGAVERFAQDKALGQIGAVAKQEQEAAKAKTQKKKGRNVRAAARTRGRGARRPRVRTKSRNEASAVPGSLPDASNPVASPAL